MNTEITDTINTNGVGWVCYDADCGLCVRWAERFRGLLERRGFALRPLQSPEVRNVLRMPEDELFAEMRVITGNGEIFGGADAVIYLGRFLCKPLFALTAIPGVKPILRRVYRFVARHRGCGAGACRNSPKHHLTPALSPTSWRRGRWNLAVATPRRFKKRFFRVGKADGLPLLVLPLAAAVIGKGLAPWLYMWMLAFALFAEGKWLCLRHTLKTKWTEAVRSRSNIRSPSPQPFPPGRGRNFGYVTGDFPLSGSIQRWRLARQLGFLFGWVGMDAENFLTTERRSEVVPIREWIFAGLKILFGAMLIWVGARAAMVVDPLLAGWTGMIGIIFLLHFGLFHLLALAWRAAGIRATPLMRAPLLSQSLGEFWGHRWNTAFNQFAAQFLFRPLHRVAGVQTATMLVFLVSGLLHDLIISVPARGGYGLPTLYFLLQGTGVLFEHTRFARRLGLGHGIRGWLFTLVMTAGPAFWLFHPPFAHHVILPMLHAFGAT